MDSNFDEGFAVGYILFKFFKFLGRCIKKLAMLVWKGIKELYRLAKIGYTKLVEEIKSRRNSKQ